MLRHTKDLLYISTICLAGLPRALVYCIIHVPSLINIHYVFDDTYMIHNCGHGVRVLRVCLCKELCVAFILGFIVTSLPISMLFYTVDVLDTSSKHESMFLFKNRNITHALEKFTQV